MQDTTDKFKIAVEKSAGSIDYGNTYSIALCPEIESKKSMQLRIEDGRRSSVILMNKKEVINLSKNLENVSKQMAYEH